MVELVFNLLLTELHTGTLEAAAVEELLTLD
jgi:hypothetical protein